MLATSFFLIAWLVGFLFFFIGLERSQQLQNGVLTIYREKRLVFGMGLLAYIGVSFVLAILFIIST